MVFWRVSGITSNEIFGEFISTTVRHVPSIETEAPVSKLSVVTDSKSMTILTTSSPDISQMVPVPATIPVNILTPTHSFLAEDNSKILAMIFLVPSKSSERPSTLTTLM